MKPKAYRLRDEWTKGFPSAPIGYFWRAREANWAEAGDRIELRKKLRFGSRLEDYALHDGTVRGMELAAWRVARDLHVGADWP